MLIAGNNNNMKHISINDYVNIIQLMKENGEKIQQQIYILNKNKKLKKIK